MTGFLPSGRQTFFDASGAPLVGGKIFTYVPATTTAISTWSDYLGATLNTNPIILDAAGSCSMFAQAPVRQVVQTAAGTTISDTVTIPAFTSVNSSFGNQLVQVADAAAGRVLLGTDVRENWVNVKAFGAVCDGVTDDTAFIQAALDSFGTAGGRAIIPSGAKCLIDNNLTIPISTSLEGPHILAGTPGDNTAAAYASVGGSLRLNSTKTITVLSGASLKGLLIYRKGMTFPAANSSAFAGTAVTIGGDDASIYGCQIMGFNKAVYSSGHQRPRIEYLWHDNLNGIEITNCLDVAYISNCHAWPFSNISIGGSYTNICRSGIAYYFHDIVDWGKLTNCFSWGYNTGFRVTSANSCTLLGCGADNAYSGGPLNTGSVGFYISGNSTDTTLDNCQSAAQEYQGIYINTAGGVQTKITGFTAWGGDAGTDGILIDSGDVTIVGGCIRSQNYGVRVTSSGARVFIDDVRFETILAYPIYATTPSSLVFIGDNDYSNFTAAPTAGTVLCQSIASAASVVLPNSGKVFNITGTTNFGTLGQGWGGRTVSLVFNASLTVFNGTGAVTNMRLAGGANFAAAAGSCLTLCHNGVQWYEVGRSA